MSTPRSRRPRRPHGPPAGHPARVAACLVVSLLLVLVLAGCGSSGEEAATAATDDAGGVTTTAQAATGDGATDDERQAFSDCLAEQGVELPEGGIPGGTPDADGGTPPSPPEDADAGAMQDAMAACGDLLPAGGPTRGLPEVDQEALRIYSSCLDDHGVTLPTFEAPGDTPSTTGDDSTPPSLDPDDPDTSAALDACEPLAPEGFDLTARGGLPGGPPGTTAEDLPTDTPTDTTTDEANS